jgi:hypothetical protein
MIAILTGLIVSLIVVGISSTKCNEVEVIDDAEERRREREYRISYSNLYENTRLMSPKIDQNKKI